MEPESSKDTQFNPMSHVEAAEAAAAGGASVKLAGIDAAEAAAPPLTHAGREIQAILQVDASRTPADALADLMKLECRPLPAFVFGRMPIEPVVELEPTIGSTFCIDLPHKVTGWTAHKPCSRCTLIHELKQCERA